MKKDFWKKRIHPLLAYPILVFFAVSVVALPFAWYATTPAAAQLLFAPFEGTITSVDYVSCVCSLAIKITVQPTTDWGQTQGYQSREMLFYYAPGILEQLGIDFDWFPIPRLYTWAWLNIWYTGEAVFLGNYVPYNIFPCVAYVGTGCSIEGYYPSILNVGSSLY